MSSRPKRTDRVFDEAFRDDLTHWIGTDRKLAPKVMRLVEAIMRNPHEGIGKPEPLRYLGADTWSRRITKEHRLVYLVEEDRVTFLQARYHYG